MIHVTRLNHQPFAVNSDLIKFVEKGQDTVITLIGGEKIIVRESIEEVVQKVISFRRAVINSPTGTDQNAIAAVAAQSRS